MPESLLQVRNGATAADRKPPWLKVRLPGGETYARVKALLHELRLHTVCEEARCPNVGECWGGGTATVMLLGDVCTRGCRFCAVKTGKPGGVVDAGEPERVAAGVATLGLRYVVLTAVDRDDLPDGGAAHFAETVRALKRRVPDLLVETLSSDFRGDPAAVRTLVASGVDVFAHNVETVERLTPRVRDGRAAYRQSLGVLVEAKRARPDVYTKSSLMLGLGETEDELLGAFADLRAAAVDVLTLGQYLRPTPRHLPVHEYVPPERFDALRARAEALGFLYVAAGPLVRSSYRAAEHFVEGVVRAGRAGPTRLPEATDVRR